MISETMYKHHREQNYQMAQKKVFQEQEKKERVQNYRKMISNNPYRKERGKEYGKVNTDKSDKG